MPICAKEEASGSPTKRSAASATVENFIFIFGVALVQTRDVAAPRSIHTLRATAGQGALFRIVFISELVKARIVWVRMLPSMSADSNTLAAVSSSGASNTHT